MVLCLTPAGTPRNAQADYNPCTTAGTSLVRLDVSDNPMTGEAASALAQMLGRHAGLQALNLSDTALGDEGVSAVVKALHASSYSLQVGTPSWESFPIRLFVGCILEVAGQVIEGMICGRVSCFQGSRPP